MADHTCISSAVRISLVVLPFHQGRNHAGWIYRLKHSVDLVEVEGKIFD